MSLAFRTIVFGFALIACGGDKSPPSTGSAGSGSGSSIVAKLTIDAPEAPLPTEMGSDGLPLVCGEYKAAIDKLATCKDLPENARQSLIDVYKDTSKDWGQLPADAKRNLVTVCRAGADSVLKGAKATCGW
ncbi:MAG: hypothetical protein QM831_27455 [Kofleriaceae bacterium]